MGEPTPGPWSIYEDNDGEWHVVAGDDGEFTIVGFVGFGEADARLIAAAPDLLRALELTVPRLNARGHADCASCEEIAEIGREAIAKATGALMADSEAIER